ncbi:Uncharacterised protein [Escherichia coli]|uniref:Uncharacterized protein n=1 Tax=Escherichia coli TaxID=562 RepID=A0A2X3K8M1_ECOLX|nr:Uncharacterised protein [Escherichia coli]
MIFYRCIMSPNMMLARTRPLQFQQGPFFIPEQYKKPNDNRDLLSG